MSNAESRSIVQDVTWLSGFTTPVARFTPLPVRARYSGPAVAPGLPFPYPQPVFARLWPLGVALPTLCVTHALAVSLLSYQVTEASLVRTLVLASGPCLPGFPFRHLKYGMTQCLESSSCADFFHSCMGVGEGGRHVGQGLYVPTVYIGTCARVYHIVREYTNTQVTGLLALIP